MLKNKKYLNNTELSLHSSKRGNILIILILILLIGIVTFTLFYVNENYSAINAQVVKFIENSEIANVSRVVDGDTVELSSGEKVRLLGINTPEKGEYLYLEAKDFLRRNVEGKTVILKSGKEDKDRYNRLLRWVYINDENINLKLVYNGFANPYFPSSDKRFEADFFRAWDKCLINNKNLCEKSSEDCALCIKLNNLDVENQKVELENICSFSCDLDGWSMKDEGRKEFVFENVKIDGSDNLKIVVGNGVDSKNTIYWHNSEYVWTRGGDTLFLRDKEGKRVLYSHY